MQFLLVGRWLNRTRLVVVLAVLTGVAAASGAVMVWYPQLPELVAAELGFRDSQHEADDGHDHGSAEETKTDPTVEAEDGHDHASHAGEEHPESVEAAPAFDHRHNEAETIKLSAQAQANIGVQLTRVELQPFDRSVTLPGMVVERPGWSIVEVDLLQVQTDFLRTVEELDVIGREIARLEKIAADGVIAGKTLLERKYDQQRQGAMLRTLRQALLLHGLSGEQVDTIMRTRSLFQELTIFAPVAKTDSSGPTLPKVLQVRQLNVSQGRAVTAGDALCALANYAELYIEGQAFEQDMPSIVQVAAEKRDVAVSLDAKHADPVNLSDLKILYMDDLVDAQSRTFHFYITLPNQLLREDKSPQGQRFVYWQFRPGQRAQISLPVERWEDRIVLPVEAVASDGAEFYVFEANGDHFDRRSVNVEFRDQRSAVIANDGSLRIGSQVAKSAAHQMQLSMKNKAGGGVDPHAGHNH